MKTSRVVAIVVVTALVTAGLTWWVLRTYVFPTRFEPVQLSAREAVVLDAKLRRVGIEPALWRPRETQPLRATQPLERRAERGPVRERAPEPLPPLEPEPYREDPASREIAIRERELNALLAYNTNLADRLAIDLSDDLASAKLLVPVDPDFPVLGGRILRVAAGVAAMRVRDGALELVLKE